MRSHRLARLLLIAAFLAAQGAALGHQIWHLASASGPQAAVQAGQPGDGTSGNPLCAQHAALGDVLGALNGASAMPVLGALDAERALSAITAGVSASALSPSSRDPPAYL